tara:strand:+ start:3647 stop:3802 length:156 start_codon:yes stop_codon:yes gene_type:complete
MNMDFTIEDIDLQGQEVYFTLRRSDGVKGEIQLNMWSIIRDDWDYVINWKE